MVEGLGSLVLGLRLRAWGVWFRTFLRRLESKFAP